VWRHPTLTIPSLITRRQSVTASIQNLPDPATKSAQPTVDRVDMSGETIRLSIRLRLAVDFLHVMYIKDAEIMVFNFIFDLSWRGWSSSVRYECVAFFRIP
jgi:hypothetical protein